MIAELSAAMAAIKETAGLAKVINDAKTDAEVKAATIELQSKLITLQAECFSLGDAIRAKEDEAAILRSKLAVLEDFKKATQEYSILKTPGGTLVYSALIDGSNDQFAINACPRCFQQSQLSILQPSPTTHSMGGYFIHYCPLCKSEFKMDKVPPMPPVQVPRRLRRSF
ncbi:hypothetical protein ACLETW_07750 [Citrobacter portucalensis]|uniref:hypothetical protein n=1 Tax=Citrobacter freundii complex TaxID=1344959 RepID=UPI00067F5DF2|nr:MULTISPECIES: hypothetical protein [Citrobacter freundii complex]MDT7365992.1 hypothetical protein [Citrobacter freundii]